MATRRVTEGTVQRIDEGALRVLVPRVLAGLVRRGEDFDAAEDALQEALLEDQRFRAAVEELGGYGTEEMGRRIR